MTEPHENWIDMAEEERYTAETLDPERAARNTCFHCQQCIEMYLKAALTREKATFPKTHNLIVLSELLAAGDPRFSSLTEQLELLNPHAVVTRYSAGAVSAEDAEAAREVMRELREALRSLMELDPAPDKENENEAESGEPDHEGRIPCPTSKQESQP